MRVSKSKAAESQQVIEFFGRVSERLRSQNRHFDDAVANHCIRLILEYADNGHRDAVTASALRGPDRG